MKIVRKKKVRRVQAEKLLSSSENVQRINELRRLCYPSPTGKVGRPPLKIDYFGGP